VEDRPDNFVADPHNFLRKVGAREGVPAEAKAEVTNRMITQSGRFDPRKACH